MRITFQDPVFSAADEGFLNMYLPGMFGDDKEAVTVEVVKDPDAFGRIDEGTFLFAPHLECGVFARALEGEGRGPVVCVGSDVGEYVDG